MAVVIELLVFLVVGFVLLSALLTATSALFASIRQALPRYKYVLITILGILGLVLVVNLFPDLISKDSTAISLGSHTENEVIISFPALLIILLFAFIVFLMIFKKFSPLIDEYVKKLVEELRERK